MGAFIASTPAIALSFQNYSCETDYVTPDGALRLIVNLKVIDTVTAMALKP